MKITSLATTLGLVALLSAGGLSPALGTDAEVTKKADIYNLGLQVGDRNTDRAFTWYTKKVGKQSVKIAPAKDLVRGKLPEDARRVKEEKSGVSIDRARLFHQAHVTGLKENTTYAYQVGSDKNGWSDVYTFSTPKSFSTNSGEFLAVGDPQIGSGNGEPNDAEGWNRTVTSATQAHPNARFLLSLGDQIDTGTGKQYDAFFAPDVMRTLPHMTIKGNHEMFNPVSHNQHFRQPNQKGTGNYWYKDAGVLFIVLDSNNPNWKKHGQFIQEVKADQGRDANWTIVAFHHAPYSSGPHRDDADVKRLRKKLPKYIAEADVDLVMNGHDHVYTRSYLTNGDGQKVVGARGGSKQVKKKGETIYVTATSSSGSKFYSNKEGADWAAVAKGNKVPGYVGVKAQRCSLRVTAYEVAKTGKRGTLDSFTLTDPSNRGCK